MARSMFRRSPSSSGDTKVNASPGRSARPVRPDAVDVVLGHRGTSKFTTWPSSSTSMPRAAMSVATSTGYRPALEAGERGRALRLRAVAVDPLGRMPALTRWSARRLARCLVRVKTSACCMSPALQQLEQQRRLELLRHRIDRLGDAAAGRRLALALDGHGVLQHLGGQRAMGGGIVALKKSVWRFAGTCLRIRRISGRKPMSSIRSASSSTRILELRELRVGARKWSSRRPGRGDDDVHAAAEGVLLRPHADAAEHRGAGDRRVDGQIHQVLVDLRRQLARRRQHQRARRAARLVHQRVQDRQQERGRLAAAGLAQASTSRPSMAGGIESAWMGVGRRNPSSRTPCSRSGCRPSVANGTTSSSP
jgi:hypothetical protein